MEKGRAKISVIGAGNVGASAAFRIAQLELADVALIDIVEGVPQGKALDLAQMCPISGSDVSIVGSTDYEDTADSDVVIITSGIPRKPGMSRDDLISTNTKVVKSVTEQVVSHSPEAILILVTNPLDAMVYVAHRVSGLADSKVMGMAGVLDSARFRAFICDGTRGLGREHTRFGSGRTRRHNGPASEPDHRGGHSHSGACSR